MQTLTELQPQSEQILLPVADRNVAETETAETEPSTESPTPVETAPVAISTGFCTAHSERLGVEVPAYRLGLCKRCFEGYPINRKRETIVHPVDTVYSYSR